MTDFIDKISNGEEPPKIEKLTEEQEALIPKYREKWLKIGLSTDRIDRERAKGIIDRFYTEIIKTNSPQRIEFTDSPISGWEKVCELIIPDDIEVDFVWPYMDGSFWAPWAAYFEYMDEVVGVIDCPEYQVIKDLTCLGLLYPFEDICVVTEKPSEINLKDGRLHKDGGPALSYADGFSVWALNGVRVSQELAETPHHKLDPAIILHEKNAEVRREIVRKIGIERISEALNSEVIDAKDGYELVVIDLQDETKRRRPYLKMVNPSIEGVYHMEGVPPEIKTVDQALAWRNGTDKSPIVLT
jgi:hypothetical protein